MQAAQARFASLEALQKAALGEGDEGVQRWLEGENIDGDRRVAKTLDVADGWERAVETVLGDYLQAVCVPDIEPLTASIANLKSGNVTLLLDSAADASAAGAPEMLAGKVRGAPQSISGILSRVRIAESLGEALAMRDTLREGESVVTADGIWLGRSWLRVSRDKDSRSGVLSREHEMRRVKANLREYRARFESARKLLTDGRMRLTQLEERREMMQGDASAVMSEYSEVRSALDSLRYQLEQISAREAAITQEAHEVENEKVSAEEQLRESQRLFVQADGSLEELTAERDSLEARRAELREELERVRARAREDRDAVQKIRIQFESRRSSKESAAQNLQRMQSQLQAIPDPGAGYPRAARAAQGAAR